MLERGDSYRVATYGPISDEDKNKKVDLKQELEMDEHRIPVHELLNRYQTNMETGLSSEVARRRLQLDGPNKISPAKPMPDWILFLKNFFGNFSLLLWVGSVLCFIAFGLQFVAYDDPPFDNLYIGIVLAVIVIFTGIFTFVLDRKSQNIMNSFKKSIPARASVIRDGKLIEIPCENLVIGDIVEIKYGDRIPADIRILKAASFKVDNSTLTGESEPQLKTPNYSHENPLETRNLIFFSTFAVEGTATGVVVQVGDSTVMGRIANLASVVSNENTPIRRELRHFIHIVSVIAAIMGISYFTATLLLGYNWYESVVYMIGIVVAIIPEGLMATVSICLALTANKLAKKNCLVKNYLAVETLGSTSVIITSKTGTLTQNMLMVTHLWFDGVMHDALGSDEGGGQEPWRELDTWQALGRVAALCNRADFRDDQDDIPVDKRVCIGDSTESALLRCVEMTISGIRVYRAQNPKIFEIPFNSTQKFHLTVHHTEDGDRRFLLCIKGAAECVLEKCSSILINGRNMELTNEWKDAFNLAYNDLGHLGERLIGLADYRLPVEEFPRDHDFTVNEKHIPQNNFRFLGLISMVDPPRSAVPNAIIKCRSAGIKVIMVTGDHPITAKSVARAVGIISEHSKTADEIAFERNIPLNEVKEGEASACVVHGRDLRDMSPSQIDSMLRNHHEIVLARISPQQKLLIVEGCQRAGEIVAVTGDGVNDSPALKKADIGIGMGSGSDVSKDVADLILLDDNFASIVTGIEEGRIIFDNLKKTIAYILTSNVPEIAPFLLFLIANVPLPLGTITILCIDLGTDILPGISLAFEDAESSIMNRRPRDIQEDKLISERMISMTYGQIGMIQTAAGFFAYFVVMTENGFWPSRLIGLRREWDSYSINDLSDSYGQEWTYDQRKQLEFTGQTAFFVAIVIVQWANLLICKTRINSIFQQGMYNHVLTFALFFETTLAIIFSYVPGLNTGLRMQPLRFTWWLPAMPFSLAILIYDEIRKFLLRRFNPGNWLEKETYY